MLVFGDDGLALMGEATKVFPAPIEMGSKPHLFSKTGNAVALETIPKEDHHPENEDGSAKTHLFKFACLNNRSMTIFVDTIPSSVIANAMLSAVIDHHHPDAHEKVDSEGESDTVTTKLSTLETNLPAGIHMVDPAALVSGKKGVVSETPEDSLLEMDYAATGPGTAVMENAASVMMDSPRKEPIMEKVFESDEVHVVRSGMRIAMSMILTKLVKLTLPDAIPLMKAVNINPVSIGRVTLVHWD